MKKSIEEHLQEIDEDIRGNFMRNMINCFCAQKDSKMVRKCCSILVEKENDWNVHNILHGPTKTSLNFTNENNDQVSALEILQVEQLVHDSSEDVTRCMKHNLTDTATKPWIINTHVALTEKKNNCKIYTVAFFLTLFEVVIHYGNMVYDIYSDCDLMKEYNRMSITGNGTILAINASLYEAKKLKDSYLTGYWITLLVVIISITMLLVTILLAPFPDWAQQIRTKKRKGIMFFLIKCFWPFFHFYEKFMYNADENKTSRQSNINNYNTTIKALKLYELSLENSAQLFLNFWINRHYIPYLVSLGSSEFLRMSWVGFIGILSFGLTESTFLEKICGKNLLAVVSLVFSLSLAVWDKPGLELTAKILKMIPMAFAILLKICTRIIVFIFLVLHESDVGTGKYWILAVIHVSTMLIVLVLFETNKTQKPIGKQEPYSKSKHCIEKAKLGMNLAIRSLASLLVLPSPQNEAQQKKTIISRSLYEILTILEAMIVVSVAESPELAQLRQKAWISLPLLVFLFWLASIVLQVIQGSFVNESILNLLFPK